MEKLITKEIDFVLEPTYTKVSKTVNNIIKELINIVGPQYSNIIKERISKTNFVFFNKITDLKKYCETNSENIKNLKNKKIDSKYETISKNIINYENKVNKLNKKIKNEFILEIKDELSAEDQAYINNHKKLDLDKIAGSKIFFDEKETENLIDGIFLYFSNDYEKKLTDKTTSIAEMELIFNNRERCLRTLGLKNINVKNFDKNTFEHIFDVINKYNNEYKNTIQNYNLEKNKIIDEFLLNEKNIKENKNNKVSKYYSELLKKDKNEIDKINEKIINKIMKSDSPEIIWASENYSDDENMRFLIFSPTMSFENNDFLLVQQICRLAFNSEYFNNKSVVQDNSLIGKDQYLMFSNVTIDYIATQITNNLLEKNINIINSEPKNNTIDINTDIFLVEKFYKMYNSQIIEALINNDKSYIINKIGTSNFENYVNIINKYFYDHHGNLLSLKERRKVVFTSTIQKILNISLQNMEQYRKILINKDKYSATNE